MKKIFSFIHISDLHYSCPKLQKKDLLNKRLLGYWNETIKKKYLINARRKDFFQNLATYIEQQGCDLLVITGDLSNLAFDEEFQQAKKEIKYYFFKQKTIIIAGNHDRYLKKITDEERFEKYFSENSPFSWSKREQKSIHTIEIANKFQLVFFDMAVPNILSARGKLSKNFFDEYHQKIKSDSSYQKIGFGHYPLGLADSKKEAYFRRLSKTKKLEKLLMKDKFVAYFHGHIHENWIRNFTLANHTMSCVNSGGSVLDRKMKFPSCHQMEIFSDGAWKINPILHNLSGIR